MQIVNIQHKIYEIRGQRVMLDFDLATLYEVETRALKQAVKRNIDRFPNDFIFHLNQLEIEKLVSQNVIPSKSKFGGAIPLAFTEQGVAMLSSVLKSKKALKINITIMRTFVLLREFALSYKEMTEKIRLIEIKYDKKFKDVLEAINYLLKKDKIVSEQSNRRRIGYHAKVSE